MPPAVAEPPKPQTTPRPPVPVEAEPLSPALIARLPRQGCWTPAAYLEAFGPEMVEFVEGRIEEPPVASYVHQRIQTDLYEALRGARGQGRFLFPPFRIRIGGGRRFRAPDLTYLTPAQCAAIDERNVYTDAARAVFEIVSPDDPNRDLVEKRADYAAAEIPEYWIIDPRPDQRQILVLTLQAGLYIEHGRFRVGDTAEGLVLPGATVDVAALLAG